LKVFESIKDINQYLNVSESSIKFGRCCQSVNEDGE